MIKKPAKTKAKEKKELSPRAKKKAPPKAAARLVTERYREEMPPPKSVGKRPLPKGTPSAFHKTSPAKSVMPAQVLSLPPQAAAKKLLSEKRPIAKPIKAALAAPPLEKKPPLVAIPSSAAPEKTVKKAGLPKIETAPSDIKEKALGPSRIPPAPARASTPAPVPVRPRAVRAPAQQRPPPPTPKRETAAVPVLPKEPEKEKKQPMEQVAVSPVSPLAPPAMPKAETAKIQEPRQKIKINEMITVSQLSQRLNVKASDIIKKLMAMGTLATLNQRLETDAASLVCAEFGFDAETVPLYGEELFDEEKDKDEDLKPRPPIITIMGHVDHGKTSLLDAIRKSNITETEAGGITQHIGAYAVNFKAGTLVFLDTPGHEAFSAMRARGAQATDIVVLVVAADDGVMPQTVEAIDHARAANVPIVVAMNKMDLPAANLQRIKQELSQHNLSPEEWGGKNIFVEVSAKTGAGIENLLNMLLLQAEILELKANPNRAAQGIVVEARMDPKAGPRATVLVTRGTLRVGDIFVAGVTHGKAKALLDDRGRRLKEAGPSMPVEILGCEAVPHAGDRLRVLQDERAAREIAEGRKSRVRDEYLARHRHLRLDELYASVAKGIVKELKIILKADVRGSTQALGDSLQKLATSEIKLSVIHAGVGGINESDVLLAAASDAIIIGFNVRPEGGAAALADKEGVDIRTYRIIYEAVAEVKAAMEGLLEPESREVAMGRVEVRKLFQVPKAGFIAGCFVQEGKISRAARIRLLRDSVIVFEGKISSLRRFKEDVREVEKGFECGVGLENFQDIKTGDLMEVYSKELVARKLAPSEGAKS